MATATQTAEWLNRLLRGELSAVETYTQAVEKFQGKPEQAQLQSLLSDHQGTVQVLREHVARTGGAPSTSSGAWGAWANFVQGTASLFGTAAALKAIKEGEEHGMKEYERALEDTNLEPECRTLIQSQLLPQSQAHIPAIDRLMTAQA